MMNTFKPHDTLATVNASNDTAVSRTSLLTALVLWASVCASFYCSFCTASTAFAQEETVRFGVYGNVALNQHAANFRGFPEFYTPSPNDASPFFQIGTGTGYTVGAIIDVPLADRFRLSFRGNYSTHDAVLRRSEQVPLVDAVGNEIAGSREFILSTYLSSASIEPLVSWQPFKRLSGFSVLAGGRAGLLLSGTFDQRTRIIEQVSGTVRIDRPTFKGELIPSLQAFQASVVAGLAYEIPFELTNALPGGLPATLIIAPEATISYGVTPFVQGLTWSGSALRAGIAVKFMPSVTSNFTTPASVRTAATEKFNAEIAATALDEEGKETPLVRLRVEEFASKQLYPLLPYIFFELGSAALPVRYRRLFPTETAQFGDSSLVKSEPLDVYYHLLNVVGKRMREHPTATLKIIGCTGETAETADATLARRRAETVGSYLREVWGIAQERLRFEARGLPRKPTMTRDIVLNSEENRRVELASDDWNILKPIIMSDTLREVSPPALKFTITARAEAGVAKWSVRALQGVKKPLKNITGSGTPDPSVLWRIAREPGNIPTQDRALKFNLEVVDNEEREVEATGSIPVELVTAQKRRAKNDDKRVDVFHLINFEPERLEATTEHLRMIDEFVRPSITSESSLLVTGYTDLAGDVSDNKTLSEKRAQAIAKQLLSGNALTDDVRPRGVGSKVQLYPNTLPEGRFYARTVEIRVETPVK